MAYVYQDIHVHATHENMYYNQQNINQMPATYLEGPMASNSCTPIDPRLESYSQQQFLSPWPANQTPHQMPQFMEGPRTFFFVSEHAMNNMNRPVQASNPLPPASQRRYGSPCSQQTMSSSDSNSPPTESDVLPSTPPDYSATSPFLPHKHYTADWEAQQFQSQALLGMGMHGGPCVNPQEVNLSQATFEEEIIPTTDLSQGRAFSFCSESEDLGLTQHTETYPSRQITPELVVKKEIHVTEPSFPALYLDPDSSEYASPEPTIKSEFPSADEDAKDLDFTPRSSRKRVRNAAARSVPSNSTPERKKPKVNSTVTSHTHAKFATTVPSSRGSKILCTECKTPFSDESTYQKHMKQHHTRPFVCVFNYAGCPSTFASKNEWKRHVSSQHLALQYWLCTQDGCSKTSNPPSSSRRSSSSSPPASCSVTPTPPALPNGAIFNRKDLYTQHVRRMHVPHNVRKAQKMKKPTPEWDDHLKGLQADAEQTRCDLPRHMRCPANNCNHEFNGPQAWDERMEHVARHLERAADGKEPTVRFGGEDDLTLTNWASSAQVYVVRRADTPQGWELINPLKGEVGPSSGNGKPGSGSAAPQASSSITVAGCSDEDAEGEDDE